jgi:hypothetical protein
VEPCLCGAPTLPSGKCEKNDCPAGGAQLKWEDLSAEDQTKAIDAFFEALDDDYRAGAWDAWVDLTEKVQKILETGDLEPLRNEAIGAWEYHTEMEED